MAKLSRYFFIFYFCFFSVWAPAMDGTPISSTNSDRLPVRGEILSCSVLLCPAEPTVNDSVGIVISTSSPEDFDKSLQAYIAKNGLASVQGGKFFVTGVPMGKEKETQKTFESILEKHGALENGTQLAVLSIPTKKVRELAAQTLQALWERIKYFSPSVVRDYQTPLASEVSSSILSSVAIEIPNVVFLYSTLPLLDANLTVATHTAVLLAYSVYAQFMLNWLLRKGSGAVEQFVKNALLSLPFVVNYSVFGKFSQIVQFIQEKGVNAAASQFPTEFANFVTTQGLTLALQVNFYRIVMTNGIGAWQNSQTDPEDAKLARTVSKIIATPILALDAITLAMAGANEHPVLSIGSFDVNTGHLALAALTLTGVVLWLRPKILDPTIRWYKGFLGVIKNIRSAFSTSR